MTKRRSRFRCSFGQPPAPPATSKPNYTDSVDPTFLRGKYAPGPSDMNCTAGVRWGWLDFLDGTARGWGARVVAQNILAWERMRSSPSCDPSCQSAMEENISDTSDYIEGLAEGVERKVKWCAGQGKISPATEANAGHKLSSLRAGLQDVRERQAARGHRRKSKPPETSWLFPITIKPRPECTDRVLGAKIMQATELVDGAVEIDTKARKDRLYNRSYFQKLMLAQGVLNRLDLEASDCVKWDHPPSPEIVVARRQLQQRIEGLRREMRAMAGLRKERRR